MSTYTTKNLLPAAVRLHWSAHWLGLSFLLVLCLPVGCMLFGAKRTSLVSAEFRALAELPKLPHTATEWRAFPALFGAYFQDQFGLREELLGIAGSVKLNVLGISPTDQMLVGRDQWLFYTPSSTIETALGANPLTEDELKEWQVSLEERRDWLKARGAEYLFVLVPDKAAIYADKLPAGYVKEGPSRREQLFAYLAKHSDVPVLDLNDALMEERQRDSGDDFVFNKYGTHWTDRGGLAGYAAILSALHARFPKIEPQPRNHFQRFESRDAFNDSWSERMYLDNVKDEAFYAYRSNVPRRSIFDEGVTMPPRASTYRIPDSDLPSAVFLYDSFGRTIVPYMAEHFSTLWSYWLGAFDKEILDYHKPQVVVQLYVERILVTKEPSPNNLNRIGLGALYKGLGRRLYKLDPVALGEQLEVYGDVERTVRAGAEGGVQISTSTTQDAVLLPSGVSAVPTPWVLRLDLTAPISTELELSALVVPTDAPEAEPHREIWKAEVRAGRYDLFVEVPTGLRVTGPLAIRLSGQPLAYTLHEAELRARE